MQKHQRLRFPLIASAFVIGALLSVTPGFSRDADFGVRGGVYTEQNEGFVGAEGLFSMTPNGRWYGNPNLEHVFLDGSDLTSVSMDFHFDFASGSPYTVWAGAGPTLIHNDGSVPPGTDTTDAGLNLLLGVGAKKGNVRPYGQVKAVLADDSQIVFGVGARF